MGIHDVPQARFGPTVAVGTTIADRPPHRSVQARLRIRLLPRMTGGEASVRIGMQNAGLGNPPIEDWGETIPSHRCALTATDQDAPPQPANATLKDAQLRRVPWNSMVLVVAQHNLAKPCTDRAEDRSSLFDWFTGTTAQSDFSCTFTSAVRFMAFADRS